MYLVPWIEIEYGWGDRPEGYKVFDNKEKMIESTKESSVKGNYESGRGYFGPIRPLCYYEAPFDEEVVKTWGPDKLPHFHSHINYIK